MSGVSNTALGIASNVIATFPPATKVLLTDGDLVFLTETYECAGCHSAHYIFKRALDGSYKCLECAWTKEASAVAERI